jgi:hypothetical protein
MIMIMNMHYFPHPTLQAMLLLDETDDDLQTAIALASMNAQKTDVEIERYWGAVADILTRKGLEN